MPSKIQLISTDFDGTLVSHASDPVFDRDCMELIRELQRAARSGRSTPAAPSVCSRKAWRISPSPCSPILFSRASATFFDRPTRGWEPYGDWNARCAQAHAELYVTASSVLAEVVDFVSRETKARVIYEAERAGRPDRDQRGRDGSPDRNSSTRPKRTSRSFITSATPFTCAFATPTITRARPSRNFLA